MYPRQWIDERDKENQACRKDDSLRCVKESISSSALWNSVSKAVNEQSCKVSDPRFPTKKNKEASTNVQAARNLTTLFQKRAAKNRGSNSISWVLEGLQQVGRQLIARIVYLFVGYEEQFFGCVF